MSDVTRDFVRDLAAANGIKIPEARLDLVRQQYEGFMRGLAEINTLPLPRETEPTISYSLAQAAARVVTVIECRDASEVTERVSG